MHCVVRSFSGHLKPNRDIWTALFLPYSASSEHARVHQVRTHQRHLDTVLLRSLDFVAQGLVEADGTELASAVILKPRGNRV